MLDFNEQVTNATLKKIDETHLSLELIDGKLSKTKPTFLSTEEGEEYVLLSSDILKRLLEGMKKAQEERFEISLERDIANQMPLDFDDVLSVAKAKIKEKNLCFSEVNSHRLIKEIKKEHPNLFFNIDEYLRK